MPRVGGAGAGGAGADARPGEPDALDGFAPPVGGAGVADGTGWNGRAGAVVDGTAAGALDGGVTP